MGPNAGRRRRNSGRRFRIAVAGGTIALATLLLGMPPATGRPTPAPDVAAQQVVVDGASPGRTFDGVGAVSSSSSKLLFDYAEPQRTQILDYLFKPDFGASLQVLKVEIGGDTNSTTTAEPSFERTRGEVDCNRGYEWWLMEQAERRNPDIQLYGLMWGAPGWLSGFYSQDQVDYLMSWLGCATEHGLHVDYLGGANERGGSESQMRAFYIALHDAVSRSFPDTKIVASDEHHPPDYWRFATWMNGDAQLSNAVDVLGEHDVCVWLSPYEHCNASQDALDSGKPLWTSEQSAAIDGDGADSLARATNRLYIDARVTGNLNWALTAGMYPDTATGGTGLVVDSTPWSGAYQVTPDVWVDAQTTQFTEPGWRYLDAGSGYLAAGGSYVSLRDPASGDYTIVVETTESSAPETVRFSTTGGLADSTVHAWATDLTSPRPSDWFARIADLTPVGRAFQMTLQPGRVYTFSTTTGQHKGDGGAEQRSDRSAVQLPLPYRESFERPDPAASARYFQDVQGAFEAAPCAGGRLGTCYRQVITDAPIPWHATRAEPVSIVGDPRWWGDYTVGVDTLLEQPGYADLIGRVENYDGASLSGYHFQVADSGAWTIYAEDQTGTDTVLASGTAAPLGVGTWHHLALSFRGLRITASVDGTPLTTFTDGHHTAGQVGLGTMAYRTAEFDNLSVVPDGPRPVLLPHATMTATATSESAAEIDYHRHPARYAVDDRVESGWQTDSTDALPQSLTLDLGRVQPVAALVYRPPFDKRSGTADDITQYRVLVSSDGRRFREVAAGDWAATTATKVAAWRTTGARFLRLTAVSSLSGVAAAREVNVSRTPISGFAAAG